MAQESRFASPRGPFETRKAYLRRLYWEMMDAILEDDTRDERP